ncbi:MAG: hypothetical protein V7751_01805 [Pseudoalteromonas distincta]|tara:strand:- start:13084 stop:13311 length:228 start_codon:yes stop_codon:yes gene_type:complete
MNSDKPSNQPVENNTAEQADAEQKPQAPFKLPFSTAEAVAAKNAAQPWHLKGINPRHEKRIGMAPKGTRRSMGKR